MQPIKRPELLAPAGSLKKLKIAIEYGADAVYIGGEAFSLRTAAENFSNEEILEGIAYAHERGKKVYITANIFLHNRDLPAFEQYLRFIAESGADAVIVSDAGALDFVREIAPDLEVHISTQANITNYKSAQFYRKMGAKRVVLARELSLDEIREVRENTDSCLELEAFVHGAMCISYSGRCLLSNYMTGRDSNQGSCAHPCRWNYALMEEKRPGEYFPVYENERGSFIMNSKDLCMLGHIPELIAAGIDSLKIEGRVKTEFYVATVAKAYREAIDAYLKDPEQYCFDSALRDELYKVSYRHYTTGFFFGRPDDAAQVYESSTYIREYDLIAVVEHYDPETGMAVLSQRNKFSVGETFEVLSPGQPFYQQTISEMFDENGQTIESAPHATMTVKLKLEHPAGPFSMLRRKKEE